MTTALALPPDQLASNNLRATETALELAPDLTLEEWKEIGHTLGRANRASGWWIGDWVNYGEDAGYVSRAKYDVAERITGLARKTLRNYAGVARRCQSARRRADLVFGHHDAVAALPASDQDKALARAATETWSIERLRSEIRQSPGRGRIYVARRHSSLIAATETLVRIGAPWQRELTEELTPPQARKQLTVLHKAQALLAEVIEAVEYRADTLATFRR